MHRRRIGVAAALFWLVAAPAIAETAALRKPSPKTPAGVTVTVKVINWRNADLVELQVAVTGSSDWKKVLGALPAGHWTSVSVPQGKDCHVDLRGKYADGQTADVSNVEVCVDKTVNLTN